MSITLVWTRLLLSFSDISQLTCAFQFCTFYKLMVFAACQLRNTDTDWQKKKSYTFAQQLGFSKNEEPQECQIVLLSSPPLSTSSSLRYFTSFHSNTNVIINYYWRQRNLPTMWHLPSTVAPKICWRFHTLVQSLRHHTRCYQDYCHMPHMPPCVFNFICQLNILLDVIVAGLKSFQYSRH